VIRSIQHVDTLCDRRELQRPFATLSTRSVFAALEAASTLLYRSLPSGPHPAMRGMADWYVLEGDTCPVLRACFECLPALAEFSVLTSAAARSSVIILARERSIVSLHPTVNARYGLACPGSYHQATRDATPRVTHPQGCGGSPGEPVPQLCLPGGARRRHAGQLGVVHVAAIP
jgi:hypothetical protein